MRILSQIRTSKLVNIELLNHVKNLADDIDLKLNLKAHIPKLVSRLSTLTAASYQCKNFFKTKKHFFRCYKIYEQLELQYSVMLYVLADKSDLQKLEWQQSQTVRLMFSVERTQSPGEVGTQHKLYLVVNAFFLFVQTNCKSS